MARPTIYNPEILTKATEYIRSCTDIENENRLVKTNVPTVEGLALYLDINKDTVYDWCKVHEEFSDVIDRLHSTQTVRLVNGGLTGSYNPTISKVLLSKRGYREGIEQTGKDGKDLIPETEISDEVKALAAQLNELAKNK